MALSQNQISNFPTVMFHKVKNGAAGLDVAMHLDAEPACDWQVIIPITRKYTQATGYKSITLFTKEEFDFFINNLTTQLNAYKRAVDTEFANVRRELNDRIDREVRTLNDTIDALDEKICGNDGYLKKMRDHYTTLINNAITTCKSYTDQVADAIVPVGTMIAIPSSVPPSSLGSNYLYCNGSTLYSHYGNGAYKKLINALNFSYSFGPSNLYNASSNLDYLYNNPLFSSSTLDTMCSRLGLDKTTDLSYDNIICKGNDITKLFVDENGNRFLTDDFFGKSCLENPYRSYSVGGTSSNSMGYKFKITLYKYSSYITVRIYYVDGYSNAYPSSPNASFNLTSSSDLLTIIETDYNLNKTIKEQLVVYSAGTSVGGKATNAETTRFSQMFPGITSMPWRSFPGGEITLLEKSSEYGYTTIKVKKGSGSARIKPITLVTDNSLSFIKSNTGFSVNTWGSYNYQWVNATAGSNNSLQLCTRLGMNLTDFIKFFNNYRSRNYSSYWNMDSNSFYYGFSWMTDGGVLNTIRGSSGYRSVTFGYSGYRPGYNYSSSTSQSTSITNTCNYDIMIVAVKKEDGNYDRDRTYVIMSNSGHSGTNFTSSTSSASLLRSKLHSCFDKINYSGNEVKGFVTFSATESCEIRYYSSATSTTSLYKVKYGFDNYNASCTIPNMNQSGIFIGGGSSGYGNVVLSGAPNIKGSIAGHYVSSDYSWFYSGSFSGALDTGTWQLQLGNLGSGKSVKECSFSGTLSSSVYQDSLDKLYPNHIVVKYYIKYR